MTRRTAKDENTADTHSGRQPAPVSKSKTPLAQGWNEPNDWEEGAEPSELSLNEIVSRQRERWLRKLAEMARLKKPKPLGPVDKAFANWISDLQREGWTVYLLTFVFNQLPGGQPARIRQMARRIERLYSALVKFVLARTKKGKDLTRLPLMIAVSESVWQSGQHRVSIHDMRPNDGDHFHAVYLLPPWAKPNSLPFDAFFAAKRATFIRAGDILRNVDIRPMDRRSKQVWSYIQKTRTRNRDAQDDVVLLPETRHPVAWLELLRRQSEASAEKTARLRALRLARDADIVSRKSAEAPKQKAANARAVKKIALIAPPRPAYGLAGLPVMTTVRTRVALPDPDQTPENLARFKRLHDHLAQLRARLKTREPIMG